MEEERGLIPNDLNLPAERMQSAKGTAPLEEEDRLIPRLKIMQPLSPEVDEGIAKPGELVNSISKKVYGKTLPIIPIVWWKSRVYWAKREDGGEILCSAKDAVNGTVYGKCADCQYSKWTDKDHPLCTAVINILAVIRGEIVAISFMKTSYSTGKQLINLFNYKNVDIFNFEYELFTAQEENDFGKFHVIKYRDSNKAVDDPTYKLCSGIYANFAKIREKVEPLTPES